MIIAVPHGNPPTTSTSIAAYMQSNPTWKHDQAGQQRPHLRLDRQLAAAGVTPTSARTIPDVRTQFLKNR